MDWAKELAGNIIKERGKKLVVSTMVTPSGPIHLGNLKEVMIGHLISKALTQQGAKVDFYFSADNFDFLRKVYPFLSKKYEKYVGWPISNIPDLEGCHETYDKHFLAPFFEALKKLKINPKINYINELYQIGTYAPFIKIALEKRNQIAKILSDISHRDIEKDWSPFMPICDNCGRMNETKIISQNLVDNLVQYKCTCGHKGEADFSKGGGKLVWRVHWPATWKILNVGIEGFGKDLATKGSAYDTAKEIIEKIFDGRAPYPIPYEWVYIKNEGRMASSTGVGFTPLEILKVMPPEVLIHFYKRSKPNKHSHFDIGEGLISLWNESDGLSGIPFEHLVMTIQASTDVEDMLASLKRTGYGEKIKKDKPKLITEIEYIKNWLEKFAPERYKFEVQKKIPKINLNDRQKKFLEKILSVMKSKNLDGAALHQQIHDIKQNFNLHPREAFSAIYLVFLGKDSGPQAGWFLASLDRDFVIKRLGAIK